LYRPFERRPHGRRLRLKAIDDSDPARDTAGSWGAQAAASEFHASKQTF